MKKLLLLAFTAMMMAGCKIVRRTAITPKMTYEERLAAQLRRYGI